MRKVLILIALCSVVLLCISSSASATLVNQWHDGDRVVYDTVNDLYWYPILTDFTSMTRSEQIDAIENLDYAGSTSWYMATWTQTSKLKISLASMATKAIVPTSFGPDFGQPVLENRDISSPWVAYDVDSASFFTSTGVFDMGIMGYTGYIADVFNGRTAGWGMTNMGTNPSGFFGDVIWSENDADDHWVTTSMFNDGDAKLTMTYNFDQHHLADSSTWNAMMGDVGAWVVTRNVPEPDILILLGIGLSGIAAVRRKIRN